MKNQSMAPKSITHWVLAAAATTLAMTNVASAQLQFTEIMYNPIGGDGFESVEWIEVRNTSDADIDLDGYYFEGLGDLHRDDFGPNITSAVASNTIVPAGETAILWDGFFGTGSPNTANDANFLNAWGLPATQAIIAVDFFPDLTNDNSDPFGLWPNKEALQMDADLDPEGMIDFNVSGFDNADYTFTYDTGAAFPSTTDGVSIAWNGNGGINGWQAGGNWEASADGVNNAITSPGLFGAAGSNLNDIDDLANPGLAWDGANGESSNVTGAQAGVTISEIMYNPRSSEDDWEWIEIYNNTGATIDFGAQPGVLDDDDGSALAAANITSGTIADDSFAILYNADDLTQQQFADAWGSGLNLIPVTDWPGLSNGGDMVAFWDLFDGDGVTTFGYLEEANDAGDMMDEPTFDLATASVLYDDDGTVFPADNGFGSIHLTDFSLDPSVGASWAIAGADGDPFADPPEFTEFTIGNNFLGFSFNATQVLDGNPEVIIEAGDVASPGALPVVIGDYNGNGYHDAGDYTLWRDAFEAGDTTLTNRDPSLSGVIGIDDYLAWKNGFIGFVEPPAAGAVPEPTSVGLLLLGLLAVPVSRRR